MKRAIELQGHRFGRLIAQWPCGINQHGIHWLCLCKCGTLHIVRGSYLRHGVSRSCGCLKREESSARRTRDNLRHGQARHEARSHEYQAWRAMRQRCMNPNATGYKYYGGRGIKVCARWQKFENFIADMGRKPEGRHGKGPLFSIDRINNDGNYEPTNCRWATRLQQSRNRRPSSHGRP